MCKILTFSCSSTQIMREIVLYSAKIYTAGTNFTRPPVMTTATNLNCGCKFPFQSEVYHVKNLIKEHGLDI